jgi:hypothetical protein
VKLNEMKRAELGDCKCWGFQDGNGHAHGAQDTWSGIQQECGTVFRGSG